MGQATPIARALVHPPAPREGRSVPPGAEPAGLAHGGGSSPGTVSGPRGAEGIFAELQGSRSCLARGPLLSPAGAAGLCLLRVPPGLASSGTSHHPDRPRSPLLSTSDRSPFASTLCSGPWLVPACVLPPHASARPVSVEEEEAVEIWALGPLLLPQAGRLAAWSAGQAFRGHGGAQGGRQGAAAALVRRPGS